VNNFGEKVKPPKKHSSEIVIYRGEDGRNRIQVRVEAETVWLTQIGLAELFQTTVPNINIHIRNILKEGELEETATVKDYLIVRQEGAHQIQWNHQAMTKTYDKLATELATGLRHDLRNWVIEVATSSIDTMRWRANKLAKQNCNEAKLGFEDELWAAEDKLCGQMDLSMYKNIFRMPKVAYPMKDLGI